MRMLSILRLFKRGSVALMIAVLLASNTGAAQKQRVPQNVLDELNKSLRDLTDRVSPAVVDIQVWGYGVNDDEGENAGSAVKQHISGSGVVLDSDGYIVTNAHVVRGAERVRVTLTASRRSGTPVRTYVEMPGAAYEAKIIGLHEDTDLAVLKIDALNLPTIRFSNYESLQQGQLVIALGSPLGMRNTATIGIVSSVARQLEPDDPVVYIQTDAALNPGNSGGALVDTSGALVGINSMVMSADRIGLAIPSDTVKFVYEQIRKLGRVQQGEIGVRVQTITPTMAAGLGLQRTSGVIVADVRPGSPADASGIHCDDIIIAVNGELIHSASQLVSLSYKIKPGGFVSVQVLRGKELLERSVPILERRTEAQPFRSVRSEQTLIPAFGISGVTVDEQVARATPGIRLPSGVLVTAMSAAGEAIDTSLKVNDIIHAVNGATVTNLSDIRTAAATLLPGSAVVLKIERQGIFMYLAYEM
jgi:serine protease Do